MISDIYDHFVVHKSPLKAKNELFRVSYKPLKQESGSKFSDLPYISRREDIENRLMTDKYYVERHEARKRQHLTKLLRKFEHRRSQSTVEELVQKEEGFDVSTLLPPDTSREELIRKMGHFQVVAPSAAPLDLSDPATRFQ